MNQKIGLKVATSYSLNFNLPKRVKNRIKFIIIHYTGMKKESSAIERLQDPKSKVSSHYLIKRNGEIISLVPDLFEAWHAKKPVVLTKVGGVGEVVTHNFNGLICEPEQQDINEKIIQASALDSDIKKLGREGYRTLNKSFTIDTMIEKLEKFFLKF